MKTDNAWRGGNEPGPWPRFGRAEREWFFQAIFHLFPDKAAKKCPSWARISWDTAEALAKALTPRGNEFTDWRPTDEYHGRRYYSGHWYVCWDDVIAEYVRLSKTGELERQQPATPPDPEQLSRGLDAWLLADIRRTAPYGPFEGLPDAMDRHAASELVRKARERQRTWPRLCPCGVEFRGDRANAKRCPACRETFRALKSANRAR